MSFEENKLDDKGVVIPANGVRRKFEIALENGVIPIPVGIIGSITKTIVNEMSKDLNLITEDMNGLPRL